MTKFSLLSLVALGATGVLAMSGMAQAQMGGPGAGAPPPDVGTVTLSAQTVPMSTVLPGRVVASATSQVRPQVGGIITAVNVVEGQQVAVGDVLFTIDSATYEAQVAVAEANVASAEAAIPSARATVERYTTLASSGGIAQTELDTARATLGQAEAALGSAEASLRVAQLTLEQASVTASISGAVGIITGQVGSLVTANQADALTTIRQLDPVDIDLVESSSNLLALRKALASGALESTGGQPPNVSLVLEDDTQYNQTGTVSAADVVISPTTGSFTIRASMPNPDRTLLPGMFVRATVSIGDQPNAFLVPQRAVTFNDDGDPTAYFVGADGMAEQRVLTATREVDNAWVVTDGIEEGDALIVDGLQKVSDGGAINPIAVVIEDNGVVYQTAPRELAEATP